MIDLPTLIDYWKERQSPHPQITAIKWDAVLHSTIHYLEQLQQLKGEQK